MSNYSEFSLWLMEIDLNTIGKRRTDKSKTLEFL